MCEEEVELGELKSLKPSHICLESLMVLRAIIINGT